MIAAVFWIWGNGSVEGTVSRFTRRRSPKLKWRNELDRLADSLATGFGAGYLPWAPGTWVSLEAVFLALAVHQVFPLQERVILGAFLLLLMVPAVFSSGRVAQFDGNSDPSRVVIDEIVGQILCLLWVPVSVISLVAGFLLFRFFDIVKPSPARESEGLGGGLGIVCDDLIAGIYAGVSLKILFFLTGQ